MTRAFDHLPVSSMQLRQLRARVFMPLFCAVFLSDCASKRAAVDELAPHMPQEVLGDVVRFTLAFNEKAAMGLHAGAQSRWILAVLASAMLIGAALWLRRTRSEDPLMFSAAALVAGGALGNLVDRLRWDRGVVDFIDIGVGETRFWIFNLADVAITSGVALLWLASRRAERSDRHARESTG